MSDEQKQKISISNKGKNKGKTMTEKFKENLSKLYKGRPAWNKGLTKETDERVRKMSEKIPKRVSKETKEKISKALKGKTSSFKGESKYTSIIVMKHSIAMIGKKPWNFGLTKETDERVRKNGEKLSKILKGKKRSKQGRLNIAIGKRWNFTTNPSIPEIKTKELLEKYNIDFILQKFIVDRYYDFYIPRFNTLLEIDGIYWHSKNLRDEQLTKAQYFNRQNDNYKNKLAIEQGYTLIRIWEDELDKLEEYIKTMWLSLL